MVWINISRVVTRNRWEVAFSHILGWGYFWLSHGVKASSAAVMIVILFLTAFALPDGFGRWRIVIKPIDVNRTLSERESVRKATQDATAYVESMVRQYPQEWSWMHRRWKAVPKESEM